MTFFRCFLAVIATFIGVAANVAYAQGQEFHQIRFKNASSRTVQSIQIGPAQFSNVEPGATTEYQDVDRGLLKVKGRYEGMGNVYLDGQVRVPGDPKRRWTVTLAENRRFSIAKDAPTRKQEQAVQAADASRVTNLIRFKNEFSVTVVTIALGPVTFRNVKPGAITSYRPISPGVYQIVGEAQGFGPASLKGSLAIENVANQRFTETLTPAGVFFLTKDP